MKRLALLTIIVWSALIAAFPIWQFIQCGHIFYTNALDEGSYLQYDYAKLVSEVARGTRGIQWLVPRLHEVGLSGGLINLLFDLICFPLTCCLLCRRLGYMRALNTISLVTLFTTINPLVDLLYRQVSASSLLPWVTLPFSPDHPLLRSPEPQFTYALAAIWPYLALPIAYPFVGLPAICGCVAYPLRRKRFALMLGVLATFLIAVIGSTFLLNPILSGYAAFSRAPLLSLSALVAFLLFLTIRARISRDEHSLLISLIVGLLTAQNQQIVTGFLIQPSNIEQYFGVPLCAYISARLLELRFANFKALLGGACITMFSLYLAGLQLRNLDLLASTTLNPLIVEQAVQDPRELIEYDIRRATTLNLVAPKQQPTLLSITAGYSLLADRFVQQYRSAKGKLMEITDERLAATIRTLDAIYLFDNRNAPLNTIGRRHDFGAAREIGAILQPPN